MSIEGPNKAGKYRYDRTIKGVRIKSGWDYLTKRKAQEAEERAATTFRETGEILTIPPIGENDSETVGQLYSRWINWLELHRSPRHAYNMRSLVARALAVWPEMADVPVNELTEGMVEEWGERWSADLAERGKTRKTINDWLRYSQTAFNPPWGRRRAKSEIQNNPFKYTDRYAIEYRAKYVPTAQEVNAIRLAADGEFRLWIEIELETGARPGEALNLAWEDVGPDHVILYTRKTADGSRVGRRLAISPDLARRFRSARKSRMDTVYVFQQEDNPAPHHMVWIRKQLKAAAERGGVKSFPPSSFRHYRASLWASEGVPLTVIRDRLGHQKATTTDNYLRQLTGL